MEPTGSSVLRVHQPGSWSLCQLLADTLHVSVHLNLVTRGSFQNSCNLVAYGTLCNRKLIGMITLMHEWDSQATFVALGLDHVVANMYFIPIAIWNSHPQITVSFYIWKSLIPTTLGNIVGGGLFVGAAYWYLFLTGSGSVDIDFNLGSLNTAMEAGGPLGRGHSRSQAMPNGQHGSEGEVIEGKVIDDVAAHVDSNASESLPHSGSYMASGIGKELSPGIYANSASHRQAIDEEKNAGR